MFWLIFVENSKMFWLIFVGKSKMLAILWFFPFQSKRNSILPIAARYPNKKKNMIARFLTNQYLR